MIHPSNVSAVGSPKSVTSRLSDGAPLYSSMSDFEIERGSPLSAYAHASPRRVPSSVDFNEHAMRTHLTSLLAAKSRPFSVSGLIPLDPANLVVFFRSKSGITHSLDFPIDVDYDLPPALDVLMAACCPHVGELEEYQPSYPTPSSRESLFYPPNLPLSATLEIANHPILEAVRNTLFSTLPVGHYLTAVRDILEIVPKGCRMTPQPLALDSRVATIDVTLPARYRGGALVVRDVDGNEEKYHGGGRSGSGSHGGGVGVGHLEWTAFLADCNHEVEEVTKGCRLSISYAVYLRTFGPSGIQPDPLITPSDRFLDLVAPILNICRGRKIAFYLAGEYGVNPAEVLAESLVPHLNGADSLLYHAMKLYKLAPELRWSAGGYIWPVDRIVECSDDIDPMIPIPRAMPGGIITDGPYRSPTTPGVFSPMNITPELNSVEVEERGNLRWRVENSGAIPIAEADIMVMSLDLNSPGVAVTKERVPFVSGGQLDKLVVNVMLVVFVP